MSLLEADQRSLDSRRVTGFRWHFSLRYSNTLVVEVSEDEDGDDDGERLHYDDASRCARYNIVSTLQLAASWSTTPTPETASHRADWASSNRCLGWRGSVALRLCTSRGAGGVQRTLCSVVSVGHRLAQRRAQQPIRIVYAPSRHTARQRRISIAFFSACLWSSSRLDGVTASSNDRSTHPLCRPAALFVTVIDC